MMLNLQNVLDQTRQESAVDLGYGIRCQTRPRDGQMSVEYWVESRHVATAYLAADLSARVDVAPAASLGTIDVIVMMAVMNLANSRASQMSYVAQINKPVGKKVDSLATMDTVEEWVVANYGPITTDQVEIAPLGCTVTAVAVRLFSGLAIGMGTSRQLAIHDLYLSLTRKPTLKTALDPFWKARREALNAEM